MGRKKRDLSYAKPFCYFCEKVFNNEIVLHQHQKSKHFTCPTCNKKFPTTSNQISHMTKTHTNAISKIPNALEGRDSADQNIFGMNGVPKHIIEERLLLGSAKYWSSVLEENEKEDKKKNPHLYENLNKKTGEEGKTKEPSTIRRFVQLPDQKIIA